MATAEATGKIRVGRMDSYLAFVPRGLHHVVMEAAKETLAPHHVETMLLGEEEPSQEEIERVASLLQSAAKKKKNAHRPGTCLQTVGTIHDTQVGRDVSMGYYYRPQCGSAKVVLSHPGQLEGFVWIHLVTDAPVTMVANELRCVGPLLALVESVKDIDLSESQSLDEAVESIKGAVSDKTHCSNMKSALQLWHEHVKETWPLSDQERDSIQQCMQGKPNNNMTFRLSCVRYQSKRYKYSRENLLRSIVNTIVPFPEWRVNLTGYNVEVVVVMQPHCLAVGLALRPYQHLGTKSFATGTMPRDVAKPYLSGDVLSGIVRLRPSTAQLLLRLACLEPGDVVLDPCAGIGTIPMEVSSGNFPALGLGGDVVLEAHGLGSVAATYAKEMQKEHGSSGELCAWDAASLPLRTSCVDVIVSDLPFGQQCMSAAKLEGFLPLVLGEAGRVLRPGTGRIVLLCGSHLTVLDALSQINDVAATGEPVWELPCTSVFPVNIGGNSAWIVQVKRGHGRAVQVANHQERVKKMASNRERIARHRAREGIDPVERGRAKYRRIQS